MAMDPETRLLAVQSGEGVFGGIALYRFSDGDFCILTRLWRMSLADIVDVDASAAAEASAQSGDGRSPSGALCEDGGPLRHLFIVGALRQLLLVSMEAKVVMLDSTTQTIQPQRLSLQPTSKDFTCLVAPTGPALIVIGPNEEGASRRLSFRAFLLSNTPGKPNFTPMNTTQTSLLSNLPPDANFSIGRLGPQDHLIIHHPRLDYIQSLLLNITTTMAKTRLVSKEQLDESTQGPVLKDSCNYGLTPSNPRLDCLFHIYDKFSTSVSLMGEAPPSTLVIALSHEWLLPVSASPNASSPSGPSPTSSRFKEYVDRIMSKSNKDLSPLRVVESTSTWDCVLDQAPPSWVNSEAWMTEVLCLTPVQIARALNGELKALKDGMEVEEGGSSSGRQHDDVHSLARDITFSTCHWVLQHYSSRPVVVISSIGAQSTGKSYFLNHVSP